MAMRKSKRGNYEIEDLGDAELPPELEEKIERLTIAAEATLDVTPMNFPARWMPPPY